MTRSVYFAPAADQDVVEAEGWYEAQQPGLGRRFLIDVRETLTLIRQRPKLFPVLHASICRAPLDDFPYILLYLEQSAQRVRVLACFHTSRDPAIWQRRR